MDGRRAMAHAVIAAPAAAGTAGGAHVQGGRIVPAWAKRALIHRANDRMGESGLVAAHAHLVNSDIMQTIRAAPAKPLACTPSAFQFSAPCGRRNMPEPCAVLATPAGDLDN